MSQTQDRLLTRLIAAAGGFVSGEDLGRELGVSRAAVASAAAGLRSAGYLIESLPHRGHRLVGRPDLLVPAELHDGLRTRSLGRAVLHHGEVETTQAIARLHAERGAAHGTLVVAETQTGGRGRLSRPYFCPPGGIWCTLIMRPLIPPALAPLISLAAGVAVATAVREAAPGLPVVVKWPNDVLIGGRKVAGILTEMAGEERAVDYVLVGTGINVNFAAESFPPELQAIATTLQSEAGGPVSRRVLVQDYLATLERLSDAIAAGHGSHVLDEWRAFPNTLGRRVAATTWDGVIEGTAVALDETGALLVARPGGGIERLVAADIVHLSPTPTVPGP